MKIITLLTSLLILSATSCTWVGTQKQIKIVTKDTSVNTQDSFYLIYPNNGFEKTLITKSLRKNPKSAKEVVEVFKGILSEELGQLTVSDGNISLEEALKDAKVKGSQYVVDVKIGQWKDASYFFCSSSQGRQGRFSEPLSSDTVDLAVLVYDVKTKKLLNEQKIENRGCPIVLLAVIPIGKNSPSSRLSPMLQEWLSNIR